MPEARPDPLIGYASNAYSQFGEDGVLRRLFELIGTTTKRCCEFGAWDGIHMSNTRALILSGWSATLIECNPSRACVLESVYSERADVHCVCSYVDADENRLAAVLLRHDLPADYDLVSIDIDGLDYEAFESMGVRPRVVCVEAGTLHDPDRTEAVPRALAMRNTGQPLARFRALGERLGYRLVCYTGNAIFLRHDIEATATLPTLTPADAYGQHLARLARTSRHQLYLSNVGLTPPYRQFQNPYLRPESLGLHGRDIPRMLPLRRLYLRGLRTAAALRSFLARSS